MSITYVVTSAAYGALAGGNENNTQAANVTGTLQTLLNQNPNGVVTINNTTMGGDPSKGNTKHFGAIVVVNGSSQAFACQEGQTIDFS
ncbi:hypothetical protein ACO0LF_17125 [Undibacterium sp. Di27W]|uniref:hypothetical protein n=1 Tax=Undibacterium sp. Di27W TaxID=3413036 RepID=UPI003BF094A5